MHAISSYRDNRHRPPARPPHTHRQDRLQYTAPQLASAQCNYFRLGGYDFISVCLLVSLLVGLRENYSTDFHKIRRKGGIRATEETVIGGDNPDCTTLRTGWVMWVPPYSAWQMLHGFRLLVNDTVFARAKQRCNNQPECRPASPSHLARRCL